MHWHQPPTTGTWVALKPPASHSPAWQEPSAQTGLWSCHRAGHAEFQCQNVTLCLRFRPIVSTNMQVPAVRYSDCTKLPLSCACGCLRRNSQPSEHEPQVHNTSPHLTSYGVVWLPRLLLRFAAFAGPFCRTQILQSRNSSAAEPHQKLEKCTRNCIVSGFNDIHPLSYLYICIYNLCMYIYIRKSSSSSSHYCYVFSY